MYSDINITTAALFWLVLVWYVFPHAYTFNLFASFNSKWVFGGSVFGSCFFIQPDDLKNC